ncbi:MAG: hypothetical protein ACE5H0_02735 [Bacteroidota bacterium]
MFAIAYLGVGDLHNDQQTQQHYRKRQKVSHGSLLQIRADMYDSELCPGDLKSEKPIIVPEKQRISLFKRRS